MRQAVSFFVFFKVPCRGRENQRTIDEAGINHTSTRQLVKIIAYFGYVRLVAYWGVNAELLKAISSIVMSTLGMGS